MAKVKAKKRQREIDWSSDEYFDKNRSVIYLEHSTECPIFTAKAEEFLKFLQAEVPERQIVMIRNGYGKIVPRPGAFEIEFSQNARTSRYCLWSGLDKGPPRRDKFPNFLSLLPDIQKILKKFYPDAKASGQFRNQCWLRKQYPFRSIGQKQSGNSHHNTDHSQSQQQQQQQQQQHLVNHVIKDEPEFQLHNNESSDHNEHNESFEEMEMEGGSVQEIDEDPLETAAQQQQQQHQQQQQQLQQQVAQAATIHTQQISVDQISADKLTLNDLLQFKTARPREEIILQIKHPADATGAQITIPSPTRITIPTHQQQHTMATITTNGYNQQIISEIKPQQITLAQYQAQQQLQQQQQQLAAQQQQQQLAQQAQLAVLQQQQQQQQQVAAAAVAAAQQQQQQQAAQQQAAAQQVKMQLHTPTATTQFATATPTFTCTTFSALPTAANTAANSLGNVVTTNPNIATITATPTLATVNAANNNAHTSTGNDTYEEKINLLRLREAELRYKEQQVALEKKKIELSQVQEQLKHLREVHRLQVEELKMKIRILQEEEKQLRKETSPMGS